MCNKLKLARKKKS